MYFFSTKAFLILAIILAKIVYLGFLASYANGITLIIWISKVLYYGPYILSVTTT